MTRQPRQFLRFLAVGVVAACVNIGARAIFNLAMPYEAAVILAFPCALATGFLLNRHLVFTASQAVGGGSGQALRFTLVNLVALVQVFAVGEVLARVVFPRIGWTWHAFTLAHAIAVGSPVFTSYFAHKHFSFASVSGPDADPPVAAGVQQGPVVGSG
jgi:putative flippase GtrA